MQLTNKLLLLNTVNLKAHILHCWSKRGRVNYHICRVKVFGFLALNHYELPITGLSGAGGGWKHWLSKLVFKCILAGFLALHYSLPIQKNVALQAGVLQQADMRPVFREVQKCRAENVVRAQLSPADYFTLTSQSMKTDQIYILNVH